MPKRKSKKPRRAIDIAHGKLTLASMPGASDFITGPKLRAKLGISAVTLWRWRHDAASRFPAPKVINGRLYFPLGAVSAWLDKQPEAA